MGNNYLAALLKYGPSLIWSVLEVKDFLCLMDELTISHTQIRKKGKHNHPVGNNHIRLHKPEMTEKWIDLGSGLAPCLTGDVMLKVLLDVSKTVSSSVTWG